MFLSKDSKSTSWNEKKSQKMNEHCSWQWTLFMTLGKVVIKVSSKFHTLYILFSQSFSSDSKWYILKSSLNSCTSLHFTNFCNKSSHSVLYAGYLKIFKSFSYKISLSNFLKSSSTASEGLPSPLNIFYLLSSKHVYYHQFAFFFSTCICLTLVG